MKATITFPSITLAKSFATAWTQKTLTGYDMSSVRMDGSVDVIVYDVDQEKETFIESYISKINAI